MSLRKSVVMMLFCLMPTQASADGNAENGALVFGKCTACHTLNQKVTKIGPHLADLFGRKAGSLEGFRYSSAMKDSGLVWDEDTLDAFLKKPTKVLKGTRMRFLGLRKEKDRADLIAYFKSLKVSDKNSGSD